MFIIFGSPRSGTTLLSTILDSNTNISIPDETDFIVPISFIIHRIKNKAIGKSMISALIVSTERFSVSIGQFLSVDEINEIVWKSDYTLDSILCNIYAEIAHKNNAVIGGDKSPNDIMNLRVLTETGLHAESIKIIHIVRDIRDVILSLKNVDWDVDWKNNIETFFPRIWCDTNMYLHNLYKENKKKYCFVKYEDLITAPKSEICKITEFLNVPFEEGMLDKSRRAEKYIGVTHHENLKNDIINTKVSAWENKMDPTMNKLIQKQALEALEAFSYKV